MANPLMELINGTKSGNMMSNMGFGQNPIQMVFGFANQFRGKSNEQMRQQVVDQINQMGGITKEQFAQFEQMVNTFGSQFGITKSDMDYIKSQIKVR